MLIARKDRVRIVPVVSVAVALLMTAGIVHGMVVKGDPPGPLLLWVGLPAALLLAYAAFALRRIERRDDHIHWGRLRLRHARKAAGCALRGQSHQGGRGWLLTVELVAHGQPLLDVTTLDDDGKADATAQRIAAALGLQYTRAARPKPAS